jgi:photosystem II stability/assembly factor-like uncharacterized protein
MVVALVILAAGASVVERGATGAGAAGQRRRRSGMVSDDVIQRQMAKWHSVGLSGGGAMFTPAISPHDPKLMVLNCDMSCAFRTADGGRTWEMIHHRYLRGNTRCRPVFHPTDPNVVYAANGWEGGLRVSRDRGKTWQPLGDGLDNGLIELAVDPGNADLMLAGGWEGVYRSTDGGRHWERGAGVAGTVAGFHIDQTSPRERRRCFAGAGNDVFVSEDGGANWHPVGQGLPQKQVLAFAGGSDERADQIVLYCSTEAEIAEGRYTGGVYRSTDGGRTWQQAMGPGIETAVTGRRGERPSQYKFLVTTSVNPMRVYAAREDPGQVFRSDDGGESWQPTLFAVPSDPGFNLQPNYITCEAGWGQDNISGLAINPADPDMVIASDWMNCQMTTDGGKTWRTVHARRVEEGAPPAKGQHWINTGLVVTTVWHYYIDPHEHNRHYIAYTDIKFARSEDAGKTWLSQWDEPLRNTTYELAFDPAVKGRIWGAFADLHDIPNANVISGRHYFARAGGGVGISDDFAATWRDSSEGLPGKPVTSIILDPRSPKEVRVLYASVFEAGVFKSTDGGKTWAKKSQGLGAPDTNMRACRLILHKDGTLFCVVTALMRDDRFVAEGPGLYRSRDGGETWEWINESHPLLWPKDFDVDPRDSNVIYLGAADANNNQGGLYKTTDGGRTWNRIGREGPEAFGATVHPKRPNWVYMCLTEGAPGPGLWLSKNGGETWEPFWGIPFRNIQRVSFDPNDADSIYVCTFGGSVWKGPAEPDGVGRER